MWRNSLSLSSKLAAAASNRHNPNLSLLLLRFSQSENHPYGFFDRSSSTTAGPTSSAAGESAKLVFLNLDRGRSFGTASAVDYSSVPAAVSAVKAKEVVDLAKHYGQCYWELSKAKLSMLVVATTGAGYVLGSGSAVDVAGLGFTCAGTMMVAAAASSLNQVFEIKNDALMNRTKRRPLPSGRISLPHAVTWASSVGIAGTALLASKANLLAAGLGASNLILYAFIYTPLKQIHPVNTWVGAIVGAIPPLLGWAAASGEVSLNGMLLPAALYFWQLPHFMALAYMCRDDYAAGGFRMLSLGDPSGQRTAAVALRNCIYLLPLGYFAYDWGITSGWFCIESTLLALAIAGTALSFYLNRTTKDARRMFHASLLYLPVFMSGLMFHRISNNEHTISAAENLENILKTENADGEEKKAKRVPPSGRGRPPVAYASVAPFPFLPAPIYAPS